MFNFLFLFILNISSLNYGISDSSYMMNTSWYYQYLNGNIETRIYTDKYFVVSIYNIKDKNFVSTKGGIYSADNGYYEVLEFNSLDSSSVGDTIFYSDFDIDIDDEIYIATGIRIDEIEFSANYLDHANPLNGSWLMSGIERRGEMRMRDVNRPRKTLKMLAGGRFQWIAYDTSKKGFYGTGGGTFTAVDGKYVENIEFFSRDSSTVGKSLEFDFEIKEGDWHHRGFSSKGDPKYEIWTQRKQ
ncbi:MAG: hypothetical protein P8L24_03230 [Cytophagales bacterium]|nr:hypothetical protein [Cytophagales bacterium]